MIFGFPLDIEIPLKSLAQTAINVRYNHNSVDIATSAGYVLRIDCNKAEEGLILNAMAIDNPLEYARMYLDREMQTWVVTEDNLDVW